MGEVIPLKKLEQSDRAKKNDPKQEVAAAVEAGEKKPKPVETEAGQPEQAENQQSFDWYLEQWNKRHNRLRLALDDAALLERAVSLDEAKEYLLIGLRQSGLLKEEALQELASKKPRQLFFSVLGKLPEKNLTLKRGIFKERTVAEDKMEQDAGGETLDELVSAWNGKEWAKWSPLKISQADQRRIFARLETSGETNETGEQEVDEEDIRGAVFEQLRQKLEESGCDQKVKLTALNKIRELEVKSFHELFS